ncbi:MAG: DUF362 domain-containing protein [Deltaproteobacteria bacterium]|nr:DUF362 domain-containing protein [Deltaproteobacteria bacterium]
MSDPKVFLCRVADGQPDQWPLAVQRLLVETPEPLAFVRKNDLIALKVHVGEPGLTTFLPPEVAGVVAKRVRALGARPFFTDSSVLYSGARSSGVGHTEVAIKHGFSLDRAGAAFVPADGIEGDLEKQIEIEGRHFAKVGVAGAIASSNGLVVVSHATGHLVSGIGATLKNIGMGCASRKGKLLQHSDTKPFVTEGKCTACGACIENCPGGALSAGEGAKAQMDEKVCTGCGECIAHCRSDAIGFRWDSSSEFLQQKMVEHALGAMRAVKGRFTCVVGMVNLTKHCDCWGAGSPKMVPDIGFALSSDPVAIDQAVMDLTEAANGKRLDQIAWPKIDGTIQLVYAERLGLGKRKYELVEV